ncbi:hypothetical protein CIG19_08575 [Enterobacterales bacterium CwR94]|nr:hypothetical protein CIG19_08575 [Enterobacterales bacterium CwR94]
MTIEWKKAQNERPPLNTLVLIYVCRGFATGMLTREGWKYFDGYRDTPDENGCLEKFTLEGNPVEHWAELTKP